MGTIWVQQFTGGLDARRLPETSQGNILLVGRDGHITRGGEFEKRAAFVKIGTLPTGVTKGLGATPAVGLYVFGSTAAPGAMPAGVTYQRLVHPTDSNVELTRVLSIDVYAGKLYVVAEFADATVSHFYDGAVIPDWFDGRSRAAVTITGGSGGGAVTSITIGGVEILGASVSWNATTDQTAADIAAQINSYISPPDYTATAVDGTVNIVAADPGTAPNGLAVVVAASGVSYSPSTQAMAGGAAASGTFQPGSFVKTYKQKVLSTSGPLLHFSGLQQPTKWKTDTVGAGFIDMSTESAGSEELTAVAAYQQYAAIFADTTVQVWYLDPDPTLNRQIQVLSNTGTGSPRSVTQFGDNDLFYLDESGLRSLRARDSSNAAATTDIGSPIDPLLTVDLRALSALERTANVIGLIEPSEKRFWLAVRDRIYVFSFFPAAKISAWTTYEPGFVIDDMVVSGRRVYLRSGDDLYVYGGTGAELTYDETQAEAWLPFLDANSPAEKKLLTGFDAAVRGTWEVRIGMNPTEAYYEASDTIGTITDTTYVFDRISTIGQSTHFSPRFLSLGGGPAKVAACVVHYEGAAGED